MSEISLQPLFDTIQNEELVRSFKKAKIYSLGGQEFIFDLLIHLFPHLKVEEGKQLKTGPTEGVYLETDDGFYRFLFGSQKPLQGVEGNEWVLLNPTDLRLIADVGVDVFPEVNFQFKLENQLLTVREGALNKVLFSMKDRLIDVDSHLGELIAVLSLAKIVGGEMLDYAERMSAYLLRKKSQVFMDAFTKIEFVDYSHINTFEDMLRILKYTENNSIVVLGGQMDTVPDVVCKKLYQKENDLILMDLFGDCKMNIYENELNPLRVKNVKDAVDMVYVLAENPSRVLLFPCMLMAETISPVLSRKFELEVVA